MSADPPQVVTQQPPIPAGIGTGSRLAQLADTSEKAALAAEKAAADFKSTAAAQMDAANKRFADVQRQQSAALSKQVNSVLGAIRQGQVNIFKAFNRT